MGPQSAEAAAAAVVDPPLLEELSELLDDVLDELVVAADVLVVEPRLSFR
jgi:hypothetical protein